MKISQLLSVRHVALGTLLVTVAVGGDSLINLLTTPAVIQESKTSVELYVPTNIDVEKESSFLYPVVGKVSAKQELVVKAKQAGVVGNILVTEGEILTTGQIMSVQVDPVLQAQLERQGIQNVLSLLREESSLSAKKVNLSSGEVALNQSSGLLALSSSVNDNRIKAAEAQLNNVLQKTSVTVVDIFSFIINNSSIFTADSMKLYRQSVDSFYGRTPNYLTTGLLYPRTSDSSILKQIENSKEENNIESETRVSLAVISELNRILEIFTESEREFLERDTLSRDDVRYVSYTKYRIQINELKSALESSLDNLSSLRDFDGTNSLTLKSAAKQAEYNYEGTLIQSKISDEIYQNTNALTSADRKVLLAQLSLGVSRAPFGGIVSEVLVEKGEYVMSGTPLFKFVGIGAQEIKVKIPEALLSKVKVGSDFLIEKEVYGKVSRIVPIVDMGGVTVFVDLTKPIINGVTLSGEINLSGSDKDENGQLLTLERAYLLFSTAGPYVVTESGEKILVEVINDGGATLVVKPEKIVTKKLKIHKGIRL